MSDMSDTGEVDPADDVLDEIGSSAEYDDEEDEDQLDIKPPQQRHATDHTTKHKHTERVRERKHKRHSRDDSRQSRGGGERRSDRESRRHRHSREKSSGRHRRHRDKSVSPRHRYRPEREYADRRSRYVTGGVSGGGGHLVGSDLRQRLQQQQQLQEEAVRHHHRYRGAAKTRLTPLMLGELGSGGGGRRREDPVMLGELSGSGRRREDPVMLGEVGSGRRREDPVSVEMQRRRDRCLQAVRHSEYQKDVSRKELEARRQRRNRDGLGHHRREEYVEHPLSRERSLSSERKRRRIEIQQRQAYVYNEEMVEEEEEIVEEEQEESGSEDNVASEEEAGESDHQNGRAESSEKSSEQSVSSDESEASGEASAESSSSSNEDDGDGEQKEEEEESSRVAELENSSGAEMAEDVRHVESRRRWRTDSRSPDADRSDPVDLRGEDRSRSPTPIQLGGPEAHEKETDRIKSVSPPSSPELQQPRLPPYLPAVLGCRNVVEFNCLNRIEEGTYGVVYRAEDKRTKEIVALKRLKMENEKEGFPITSLREINTLLKAQHENIVTVREIVVGSNMDKIYIVMDYVEHDLKSLMQTMKEKKQTFMSGEIKCLMVQMLRAVRHLHDNWILHRDLKTSNLLLSHRGILKVGDFGLAREYGSPLKNYTAVVVTLWYRAPELLLGSRMYACPIDVWSVGCIFGELLRMEPLFPGKSEADQINRIFKELGTPTDTIWPGYAQLPAVKKMTFADYPYNQLANRFGASLTEKGLNLLNKLLTYDPQRRITAEEALGHAYFDEHPRPIDPSMFPTWPAKSEVSHRKAASSPKPPSGRKNIGDEDVRFQLAGGTAGGGGGFSLKF